MNLPITPVADSRPTTVSPRIAATPVLSHQTRCRLRWTPLVQAIAPQSIPSTRNHGSLNSRSCRSDARVSMDVQNGYWMYSIPIRLRTRRAMSIVACMMQPTLTIQHAAHKNGRSLKWDEAPSRRGRRATYRSRMPRRQRCSSTSATRSTFALAVVVTRAHGGRCLCHSWSSVRTLSSGKPRSKSRDSTPRRRA